MIIHSGCSVDSSYPQIDVHWTHITNFTDKPDVFLSKFTLYHKGGKQLNDKNWKLFFNIAPRPMVPTSQPQTAKVKHINGDWYKLEPEEGFDLMKGDSIEILYSGTEATIKETDRPLGLYFVFYDENGNEEHISEVKNYTFSPFTKPEQINRSKNDQDPIPTPEYLFKANQKLSKLSEDNLNKIVPTPKAVEQFPGLLTIDDAYKIVYESNLENEAQYLKEKLSEDLGLNLSMIQTDPGEKTIVLKIDKARSQDTSKESYNLEINETGIEISSSDPAGVFYGVQSLRALIPIEAYQQQGTSFSLGYQKISDTPRLGFRSLHLDVGRNFQSKETILRLLDVMSFYKLNHFLFYITEDEGWRLEIAQLPELTEIGAVRKHTSSFKNSVLHPAYGSGPFANDPEHHGSGYYTRNDFIEILQYAQKRHIQVIPEVNFPGHARAAIKAMEYRYDRLMEAGKEEAANEFRLIDPDDESIYLSAQAYKDNVVCVVRESTYHFYETVVEEILSMYQEAGVPISKFHIGGDEVPAGAWTGSPLVADFMAEDPEIPNRHALHAYFIRTITERLADKGLEWHGWEEVALEKTENGQYVPNSEFVNSRVVPYIWNNLFDYPDIGYKLANAGYPVVLCNVSNFYFDLAYNKDPKEPGLYWAGFIDERDAWTFAPYNMYKTTLKTSTGQDIHILRTEKRGSKTVDIAQITPGDVPPFELERLQPEAYKNIIGIEAQIWSETIKGRDMLEYYYLPKLIGFAESAWTSERSWEYMDDEEKRIAMLDKGWNAFANQLSYKELPRLSYMNKGYNYRLPTPGAIIKNGYLHANVEYPGLEVYYTLEKGAGEQETVSVLYENPVKIPEGVTVKLKCVDRSGKESRTIEL
jgi:hexosaminidase